MDIHYHTLVNYFLVIFIDLLFCCSGSKHKMIVANWSNSSVCVVCLKPKIKTIKTVAELRGLKKLIQIEANSFYKISKSKATGFTFLNVNGFEKNSKSNINFFADDTVLFSIVEHPLTSANGLNHDLNVIHEWAYQWKSGFNSDPSKQATELLFSCKKFSLNHPPPFSVGLP